MMCQRIACCVLALGLFGCASTGPAIKRLAPNPQASRVPAVCALIAILPNTPAQKAGLTVGERIASVNGVKPADAEAVSELIQKSGPAADFEMLNSSGFSRHVLIPLNKEKPRLGALCDLTGVRKPGITSAGNESVTIFEGPFVLTVSGVINEGLIFMRVHLNNYLDYRVPVDASLFHATQADQTPMQPLTPQEVMVFMHGEDGVAFIKAPPQATGPALSPATVARFPPTSHKKRKDWSREELDEVQGDADYLNGESLWPSSVAPGEAADGLIYFLEPKALPFTVQAQIEGHVFLASFGMPERVAQQMSPEQKTSFFESQKKGTALRLTLRGGKVFVGRFSSYDSLNEIVWFSSPGAGLLNTASFGLRYILWAEPLSSTQSDKKSPAAEPAN